MIRAITVQRRTHIAVIRMAKLVAATLPLLTVYTGCRENRSATDKTCPHDDGLRTYAEWYKQAVFQYTAPEDKLRHIKTNYAHVGVGSSKTEVIEAFGPPDFEEEMHPKVRNQPCNYEFMYYFEKPTDMANELKDKRIAVFFGRAGR